jgi:putative Mg2+ transporter-C (MgtC) family protein
MVSLQAVFDRAMANPLLQSAGGMAVAFLLAALIGFEREWRQRTAGLRTAVLVAVGASAFADLGVRLAGNEGVSRLVPYVISGVGFLGAGVIMKDGTNIRGLNTAATLWCSAAVGSLAGAGFGAEAALVTLFVLAGNTLLRPLVNWINRRPIASAATEAIYRVHAVCLPAMVADARERIAGELDRFHYPAKEIETSSESEDHLELSAILAASAVNTADLDAIAAALERSGVIRTATWTVATAE